ncbi:MAG TPA: class E sortase [Candidatus Saccharimonadales bacterium]|nr:class E sortase [Candidatus Saccharimonadales bacterium]
MRSIQLRRVNTALFVAIVAVLLYVITAPLLPLLMFWVESHTGSAARTLAAQLQLPAAQVANMPGDDRIVIPAMLLDQPINEGRDLSALRTGTWRRPNTSTPDKGGNTVIVGHRFTYTNPRGSFYFLNKLAPGDEVGVFWHHKRYLYRVTGAKQVAATETAVEAPSPSAELTLYTCTPLWLPKDRLVITATLENPAEANP